MKPTILTCAVMGTFPTGTHNPALPITSQEIADSCIGAAKAGAAEVALATPRTGALYGWFRGALNGLAKNGASTCNCQRR